MLDGIPLFPEQASLVFVGALARRSLNSAAVMPKRRLCMMSWCVVRSTSTAR